MQQDDDVAIVGKTEGGRVSLTLRDGRKINFRAGDKTSGYENFFRLFQNMGYKITYAQELGVCVHLKKVACIRNKN